jgi:hypothetical protein
VGEGTLVPQEVMVVSQAAAAILAAAGPVLRLDKVALKQVRAQLGHLRLKQAGSLLPLLVLPPPAQRVGLGVMEARDPGFPLIKLSLHLLVAGQVVAYPGQMTMIMVGVEGRAIMAVEVECTALAAELDCRAEAEAHLLTPL